MSGAAQDDAVLDLAALRHGYGGREVLRGASLRLSRGEIIVLVGSSASGKTTLLRLIAGLERPQAGRVLLRGVAVADGGTGLFVGPERRGLGMVFQEAALWPHLRIRDNVAIAFPPGTGRRPEAADRLLAEVGLCNQGSRRPDMLSGGQRQRVALARALATGTDLLLLDEPLSALDEPVRDRLRPLIRDVVRRRNGSALMVSHDRTDAWRLADRIAVLDEGVVSQAGTPEALYAAPATAAVARYMGAAGEIAIRGTGTEEVELVGGYRTPVASPKLARGMPGLLLAYPEGVRVTEDGLAARLCDLAFEGGRWRGRWRLAQDGGILDGLHDRRPPPFATLTLDPARTFAFATP